MSNRLPPIVGNWYSHRDKGETFQVVAVDADFRTIEIQDFDGEHAPGRRLRRTVSSEPADLSRQTSRVRMSFRWEEDDGEHQAEWVFEMRFFFRFEIEHLVARSKLALEEIRGDFAGGPLTADSREYVVVCRRPPR